MREVKEIGEIQLFESYGNITLRIIKYREDDIIGLDTTLKVLEQAELIKTLQDNLNKLLKEKDCRLCKHHGYYGCEIERECRNKSLFKPHETFEHCRDEATEKEVKTHAET